MTTIESKGQFFLQNESIRITNRIANWNALIAAAADVSRERTQQRMRPHENKAHIGSRLRRSYRTIRGLKFVASPGRTVWRALALQSSHTYFAPDRAAEYCDEHVCRCVFVCLSVTISSELYTPNR